jgi:hypothetical protein
MLVQVPFEPHVMLQVEPDSQVMSEMCAEPVLSMLHVPPSSQMMSTVCVLWALKVYWQVASAQ